MKKGIFFTYRRVKTYIKSSKYLGLQIGFCSLILRNYIIFLVV